MASDSIQQWALLHQAYCFALKHRLGALLGTADVLSRLPMPAANDCKQVLGEWISIIHFLEISPITAFNISKVLK